MLSEDDRFDVAIVGGGPAGMSAALWSSDLGLHSVLIERSEKLGGQLHQIHNPITNYPGVIVENGAELLGRFEESLALARFELMLGAEVTAIDPTEMNLSLPDGRVIKARAIIIATGVRRRRLNVTGEDEFRGRGILESGSKDRELTRGKRVVIVGGGDAAIENAIILSDYASSVTVIHRRQEFSARAEFMERVAERINVKLLRAAKVTHIGGSRQLEWVDVTDFEGERQVQRLETDYLLIRIGVEPNSELLTGESGLDANGYFLTNPECRTTLDNIFAAGDIAHPLSPTISTATGNGSTASKAIKAWLNSR